MLRMCTVSLFGHRYIDDSYYAGKELEKIISSLIKEKEYIEFLIGRNGDFDIMAAAAIKRCIKRYEATNAYLTLVLPYMTAEFRDNEKNYLDYYDNVEVYHASEKAHYKAAFGIRNRYMVERADIVICYIERKKGGAYNAVKYAMSLNKQIINTAKNTNL